MRRVESYLAMGLVVGQLVVVLLSWLLSATVGQGVRSLLSSEGIRFFFGSFVSMLQQPLLIWLLLLAMAHGCLRGSGLGAACLGRPRMRRQSALLVVVLLVAFLGVVALLTLVPHAVLLSATGRLWPSPFSRALVPIVAFGIILLSVAFGFSSRRFLTAADVCQSLSAGIARWAPLLLLYVLAVQLYGSLRFVFY